MNKLEAIAHWFQGHGIDLYYVGGAVRDWLMGKEPSDIDVCMAGANSAAEIQEMLEDLYKHDAMSNLTAVHGDFPIWIVEIDNIKYEFAMARKERKNGQSHQEFLLEVNNVTIEEDLKRRDFTVNAIAKNIVTGELVDPFHGQQHIKEKYLHMVSSAFTEDTERVFRAGRFISQLEFEPSLPLFFLCAEMAKREDMVKGIKVERVGKELQKVFEKAVKPSLFFNFLRGTGWLKYHFPELHATIGVPQKPEHHPEGDVYTHTMHCIDAVKQGDWFQRAVMLCHDLGKAEVTEVDGKNWTIKETRFLYNYTPDKVWKISSHGHEEAGVELTRNMLNRIKWQSHKIVRKVGCLVRNHMVRTILEPTNYTKIVRRTLRDLMHYELTWDDLCTTIYYDLSGRPPKPKPDTARFIQEMYMGYANMLVVMEEMVPIVNGDALHALGFTDGPLMGEIINKALELQDRGTLRKDNWLKVLKGWKPEAFENITV